MAAITIQQLNDAALDAAHIAEVATSTAPTATDRLGGVKATMRGASDRMDSRVALVEASKEVALTSINTKVAAVESAKLAANQLMIDKAAAVIGITNRGAWVTGTAYAVKDIFSNSGTWYVTVITHTASASFASDAANVRVYQGVTSADLSSSNASATMNHISAGGGAVAMSVQQKLRENASLRDFGAIGDGNPDDTDELNLALNSTATELNLAGSSYKVTALNNPLGKKLRNGKILKNVTIGAQVAETQLNSYSDDSAFVIGKEYAYRLFLRAKVGGTLTGYIYGDSTVATVANGGGYAGAANEPQVLLKETLRAAGIKNTISLTNRGIGGTRVAQMDAISDIGVGATDVFFIKYGINDAQDGLSGYATNLRAKLAEIRANAYGTVNNLTIVLIGPNSVYNPTGGRGPVWFEQLRGVHIAAARDYQCVFIDTYAKYRDMEWAATYLLDNPTADGQGVHPLDIMQRWIWADVANALVSRGDIKNNQNLNGSLIPSGTWTALGGGSALPAAYFGDSGVVHVTGVVAGGNAASGQVVAALPSPEFYPALTEYFTAVTATGICAVRVQPSGNIEIHDANASSSYLSLCGITFRV